MDYIVKSGWYIMMLSQIGIIGAHQIEKIKEQPDEGFLSETMAIKEMIRLISIRGINSNMWDSFTVMKIFYTE